MQDKTDNTNLCQHKDERYKLKMSRSLLSSGILCSRLRRATIPHAVLIQFVLLKMGMLMFETYRGYNVTYILLMNKANCALKLVNEISLYYDARSKKRSNFKFYFNNYLDTFLYDVVMRSVKVLS